MVIYQSSNCLSQLLSKVKLPLKDKTVQHFGSKQKNLCMYIQIYINFLKYSYSSYDT